MKPISSYSWSAMIILVLATSPLQADEWRTLFDGNILAGLRGYRMEGFPVKTWEVTPDYLKTIPGRSVDLITEQVFEDFEFEFEWKVPPGGNSGVMYRVAEINAPTYHSGPEYQVLDDTRHPDGRNPKTTSGSLYALIAPSDEKQLEAVGSWNKSRIVMENGQVEHWLNGKKVVEYEWNSSKVRELIRESKFAAWPEFMQQTSGHIAIQHHGEEAWFRNIRVRNLGTTPSNQLSKSEKRAGWKLLFDGSSTAHWRGIGQEDFPKKGWKVQDGVLLHQDDAGGGDIITREKFSEFDFRFDWKIGPGGNSGVKYFIMEDRGAIGHEYQLLDDAGPVDARDRNDHMTSSFYDVLPPSAQLPLKPSGEWNQSRIVVRDDIVQHWLNGAMVLEYNLDSSEVKRAIQDSKFRNYDVFGTHVEGQILLQDHGDEIAFRNLKIRDLSE